MRLEQGKLCLCIRKAEQSFKQLFSQKRAFSEHMEKWQDDDLYDMYDHNQFVPLLDDPTGKELEQAIAYQRQLGRGFLKIDTREKLDEALIKRFSLEECCTETMLLRNKKENIARWKSNPDVIIYDSASGDVLADLLKIDIEIFASDYGEDFIRRRDARYVKKGDGDTGISLLCGISGWKTGRCLLCICDRWLCGDGCSCCKGSISQALRGNHTYETHCISV